MGLTLRLTPRWGLSLEYRWLHALNQVEGLGYYEAAGNWFTAGMVYTLPYEDDRALRRF